MFKMVVDFASIQSNVWQAGAGLNIFMFEPDGGLNLVHLLFILNTF